MLVLRTIIATISSIVIMFFLSKLMGNKQISQLNLFDYINGITIGSIAAEMAVSDSFDNFWTSAIAMTLYGLTAFCLSVLTMKSIKARHFFSGRPLLLIEDGKLYPHNLKTAKLDICDLLTRARNEGYFDLSQIAFAILENNGAISFMPKADERPATNKDLKQHIEDDKLVINVIIDGNIIEKNLRYSGNDKKWLDKELHKQGFSNAENIFLATIDGNNSLTIYPQDDRKVLKEFFNT